MTSQEFDVMMAEALTRIGRNVPSLKHRFAYIGDWKKDAIRNHTLIATYGPLSIADTLEEAVESREETGELHPSYLSSIAANLRRMADAGDDGDRPLSMPTSIPEKAMRSYCEHLRRFGDTVCRGEHLERFGADGIREAFAKRGLDVGVSVVENRFGPMTMAVCERDGSGYSRVAAVMPTVKITLLKKGGQKG